MDLAGRKPKIDVAVDDVWDEIEALRVQVEQITWNPVLTMKLVGLPLLIAKLIRSDSTSPTTWVEEGW